MRIVLFGAGASFGAEKCQPYCPPPGAELFKDLRSRCPDTWGAIPESDYSKFVPNFEIGMGQLWEGGSHDTTRLLNALAMYFAVFRPLGGNGYTRLLEYLDSYGALNDVHYSTLNYDCILEYAARDYGFSNIEYFADRPTQDGRISVWKLHGSCNFLPQGIQGNPAVVSFNPSVVQWNVATAAVNASLVAPFLSQNVFTPVMAVFMDGKPINSNPSVLKQLQEWWEAAVMSADSVGIVGVRPNPADAHIWTPLARTKAELVVIGNREAYEEWCRGQRSTHATRIVGSRFAESLPLFAKAFAGRDA